MKPKIIFLSMMLAAVQGMAQQKPKKTIANSELLTNSSIIELSKAGFGDDVILAKITSSQSKFDLSTAKLIELKNAGASSAVIKAMMNKGNGAASSASLAQPIAQPVKIAPSAKTSTATIQILNCPYYFDKSANSYKTTEKATSTMRTKNKAFGYGGVDVMFEIDGNKSPVRISQTDSLSFVLNTGGNPLPELVLYKLKVDDKKRSALSMSAKIFSGLKTPKNTIPYNTMQLGNGLYRFVFQDKLASGEYFFSGKPVNNNSIDVFAFGID